MYGQPERVAAHGRPSRHVAEGSHREKGRRLDRTVQFISDRALQLCHAQWDVESLNDVGKTLGTGWKMRADGRVRGERA